MDLVKKFSEFYERKGSLSCSLNSTNGPSGHKPDESN